jgi:hypothetical protein
MESQIELWETKLSQSQEKLADPRIATDEQKAREVYSEFEEAKEAIERLYTRWAELEALQVES